jgi:adenosylcobyric acid synthase
VRAAQLDLLGDLVCAHLDTDALVELIEHGPPPGLPFVAPGVDDHEQHIPPLA